MSAAETTTSDDVEKYISGSKVNIDNYIRKLERLDGEEKAQVIDYYSKNMQLLGILNNTFSSK